MLCFKAKEAKYQDYLHKRLFKLSNEQLKIDNLADEVTGAIITSIRKFCLMTRNHKNSKPKENITDRTTEEYRDAK